MMNIVFGFLSMLAGLLAFCTSVLYANPFAALWAVGLMTFGAWILKKDLA